MDSFVMESWRSSRVEEWWGLLLDSKLIDRVSVHGSHMKWAASPRPTSHGNVETSLLQKRESSSNEVDYISIDYDSPHKLPMISEAPLKKRLKPLASRVEAIVPGIYTVTVRLSK